MTYPQLIDYQEAVQNPAGTFTDPLLKAGRVAETPLGLPLALSGGFALTYSVQAGSRRFAVRCFHREVPEAQSRYAAISSTLSRVRSPYFVDFDFEPAGIRIRGQSYPIVRMDWVEGRTLGSELERLATKPDALRALRQKFVDLAAFLESNGIAHGDIQNDNVIIANGNLRLIDYDGMFVAGMQEGRGSEVGQKNFQHPDRQAGHFGPMMDRFSFLVVDVSLEALAAQGSLYRRFSEGGAAIIFKANDFADPAASEIFRILNGMPALRESVEKLAKICQAPLSSVPSLTDFIAGRNIPAPSGTTPIGVARPVPPQGYISAYDVLDGKDYGAVLRRVGDKVELVGQIVSVKPGIGKRGKGRGRPYVFINFGIWNQRSVKITIWSEGLGALAAPPTEAWVGRWISVTGLIEPPYDGKHYGRPYQSVGVTVAADNQIVPLTEAQAKFRLTGGVPVRRTSASEQSQRSNEKILEGLLGNGSGAAPRPRVPPSPPNSNRPSPRTRNAQILDSLQNSSGRSSGGQSIPPLSVATATSRPPQSTKAGWWSKIPGWVWVVAAIILVILLMRRR